MTHSYNIRGPNLSSDASSIQEALLSVAGIQTVAILDDRSKVVVSMENHVMMTDLNQAIASLGYQLSGEEMVSRAIAPTLRDYLPLVYIFAAIVIATYGVLFYQQDFSLHVGMRYFMGLFFLVFGAFKVTNWRAFIEAYQTYDLIAMRSRAYASIYPLIEICLAVLFISGLFLITANILTFVVMTIGALGILRGIRSGNTIQCACLGTIIKLPLSYVTLFEDLLMSSMALLAPFY